MVVPANSGAFRHFQVIAFDNRGAGRTDKPFMDYSIPLFAEDTAALMDGLGISRAHILGISMGGFIAQELALNFPERVNRLVLGCTGCGGRKAVKMSPERMAKFTATEGLTPEQILHKDMDNYFSDRFVLENPDRIEEFITISLRDYQPADAFFRQWAACQAHDTGDRLPGLAAPTLIMSGDDDPLVPPQNAFILQELITQAELALFPGLRHCFFMEAAGEFNQKVVEFLRRK